MVDLELGKKWVSKSNLPSLFIVSYCCKMYENGGLDYLLFSCKIKCTSSSSSFVGPGPVGGRN